MNENAHIPLTSAEIGLLWNGYRNEKLSYYMFHYFLEVTSDVDMKKTMQSIVNINDSNISKMETIFKSEDFPIPVAFSEVDVNMKAPPLFTEQTVIYLLKFLSELGAQYYVQCLKFTTRSDVLELVNEILSSYTKLTNEVIYILLQKGIYSKSPLLPTPTGIDFVKDDSYITGWFGERRPVHATQISQLHLNIQRNYLGKTLLMGFAQTVKSKEIRDYLNLGSKMSNRMIDKFNLMLADANLQAPVPSGFGVTTSTIPPFSDKLVLEIMLNINRYAITFYSEGLAVSTRRDLFKFYSTIVKHTAIYAHKSIDLAIKYGYLEEQPRAVDHDDIIQKRD